MHMIGMAACDTCFKWVSKTGMGRHRGSDACRRCRQANVPPGESLSSDGGSAEATGTPPSLLTPARTEWLKDLPWDDVLHCSFQTLTPPKSCAAIWDKTHDPVEELFAKRDYELGFKLHFITVQMIFMPSSHVENEPTSLRQLLKKRCAAFGRGEWKQLWHARCSVPKPPQRPDVQATRPGQPSAAPPTDRAVRKATREAEAGRPASANRALNSCPLLAPTPGIIQNLESIFYQKPPEGFDAVDPLPLVIPDEVWMSAYDFAIRDIKVPLGSHCGV